MARTLPSDAWASSTQCLDTPHSCLVLPILERLLVDATLCLQWSQTSQLGSSLSHGRSSMGPRSQTLTRVSHWFCTVCGGPQGRPCTCP